MTRWICMLALLAAPAWAQDDPEPEAPEKPAEGKPAKEKPAHFEELKRLIEAMETADGADLPAIHEQIRRLLEAARNVDRSPLGVILEVSTQSGQEKIAGSWKESGGVTGKYILSSLGKSRYKLDATRTGAEGETTKIDDEGTLAELRKKYPFIQSIAVLTFHPPDWGLDRSDLRVRRGGGTLGRLFFEGVPTNSAFGMKLRRPSKDLEFHLKLPTETAWIVEEVEPGSKADKLGLKKMDLLTEADGADLAELKTLETAKSTLAFLRRGKAERVSLAVENAVEKAEEK